MENVVEGIMIAGVKDHVGIEVRHIKVLIYTYNICAPIETSTGTHNPCVVSPKNPVLQIYPETHNLWMRFQRI